MLTQNDLRQPGVAGGIENAEHHQVLARPRFCEADGEFFGG